MAVDEVPPRALETMAAAMVATLAPVRDADFLELECQSLAGHVEAAATASRRFAADCAALESALGRGRAVLLGISVPPALGRAIRLEAARLGKDDPAALAMEVLRCVFTPDGSGGSLLGAVIDGGDVR